MSSDRPADYLVSLARELCKLPRETEWVEFKVNDAEPKAIGEYLSALANAAALVGKAFAYLVWGVRDGDHALVGTTFDPHAARVGNEELESWLLRLLEPKIDFRFFGVEVDGQPVVLLEIARSARHPVRFSGQEFLRVGPGWWCQTRLNSRKTGLTLAVDRARTPSIALGRSVPCQSGSVEVKIVQRRARQTAKEGSRHTSPVAPSSTRVHRSSDRLVATLSARQTGLARSDRNGSGRPASSPSLDYQRDLDDRDLASFNAAGVQDRDLPRRR